MVRNPQNKQKNKNETNFYFEKLIILHISIVYNKKSVYFLSLVTFWLVRTIILIKIIKFFGIIAGNVREFRFPKPDDILKNFCIKLFHKQF